MIRDQIHVSVRWALAYLMIFSSFTVNKVISNQLYVQEMLSRFNLQISESRCHHPKMTFDLLFLCMMKMCHISAPIWSDWNTTLICSDGSIGFVCTESRHARD